MSTTLETYERDWANLLKEGNRDNLSTLLSEVHHTLGKDIVLELMGTALDDMSVDEEKVHDIIYIYTTVLGYNDLMEELLESPEGPGHSFTKPSPDHPDYNIYLRLTSHRR